MNAITMLKHQHREVEALFKQLHKVRLGSARRTVFEKVADALAVHSAVEEKHFYPAVKERSTEEILLESLEEHLAVKRVIADLLRLDGDNETFAAKVKVLEDEVTHHVEEEEETLFPRVEQMFDDEALESLGDAMEDTQVALLQAGNPRQSVPGETERAATI